MLYLTKYTFVIFKHKLKKRNTEGYCKYIYLACIFFVHVVFKCMHYICGVCVCVCVCVVPVKLRVP